MNTTLITPTVSKEVRQAQEFDANNQHQQAIDILVKAIDNGDVEAMTQLGKRLLVGDRAPTQQNKAAQLLGKAAAQGSPESLALVSVLFAIGHLYEQNWSRAVQSLVVSAERGWLPAQQQLRVLTTNRKLAKLPATADLWHQLAHDIDLQAWHTPPPENTLHDSPLIRTYPKFASAEVCKWITEKSKGRLSRARVYDSIARKETTSNTRTNTSTAFNLIETDLVNVLIQARMASCVGIPFRHLEAATVLHYDIGEQITDHFDFIDPNSPDYTEQIAQRGQRIITFILYLNDDYTGGKTEFPKLGVSHKGQCGEGIFFVNALEDGSADLRSLHAGRPTIEGEKWIITQFIRDRPTF